MTDDIKPRPGTRFFGKHEHKWMFLTTKNSFIPVNEGDSDLHRMVEYAYLICNGCTQVIKEKVKTKGEANE